MKIGIDCRIYSSKFTGIGRYTHELVQNIIRINDEKKRPHEIVLFFNAPEFHDYTPPNPAVKKVLVNARHYSFAEQVKFLIKLNKEKLDFMHFPHFNVPYFYSRPYTVTIHDLTISLFPGKGNKIWKFFQRMVYDVIIKNATVTAKTVVTISKNTKKDLIERLNVPEEKIEVIYNGVSDNFTLIDDPKTFQKTLNKYKIKKEFLLYTGVWRYHKNLPRLIEAFAILRQKKNLDMSLVITGKPDLDYPETKDKVKELGLENDVIFTGLVDEEELIHLYNAANIYVFPSLYEGFGLPPLESMKCGTPVVASNTSSIPEICGEENAIFFDPYNVEDIAEKIEKVYKDVDLQAKLIENGIAHASLFSWQITGEKTYDAIMRATLN
ncbi:MAG: glycosyltransferase family 1 protein [Candidatus Peregrinibacteria bacterium]|nr:glycosyltransferase family 1 protein [Candidatus Peregrinibacteria bacterium]